MSVLALLKIKSNMHTRKKKTSLLWKAEHFLPDFLFFSNIAVVISVFFKVTIEDEEAKVTCLTNTHLIFKIIQKMLIINKKI